MKIRTETECPGCHNLIEVRHAALGTWLHCPTCNAAGGIKFALDEAKRSLKTVVENKSGEALASHKSAV